MSVCVGQTFAQSSSLTLHIEGINILKGNLMIAGFDNEADFKTKENPVFADTVEIKNNSAELVFAAITQGVYAIAVYHDENSDGTLNTVKLGIPAEGVGFSGTNKTFLKVPKFKDCRFELKHDTTIIINIHYRNSKHKTPNK